jgi:hypothetical protein
VVARDDQIKLLSAGSVQGGDLAEMMVHALNRQLRDHAGDDLHRAIEIDSAPFGRELQTRVPFRGDRLVGDRRERWRLWVAF